MEKEALARNFAKITRTVVYYKSKPMSVLDTKEERGFLMTVSLRRTLMHVLLTLTLLGSVLGWFATTVHAASVPHHTSMTGTHAIAWYCPPPPRDC